MNGHSVYSTSDYENDPDWYGFCFVFVDQIDNQWRDQK